MNMNVQRRPQFQHYPLNTQQFVDFTEQKKQIDKDIVDNLTQIRMLNNKMAKNDYQLTYLHRLQERQKVLHNKKRELQQILSTHQYLQNQVNMRKQNDQNLRSSLADDYKKAMEQKKYNELEQKRRQKQAERIMIQNNQRAFQLQQEKKRQELLQKKRAAMQQLSMRQTMRKREKQGKQRQKEQFNQKVNMRNNLQTQKQSIYKQYYTHFMNNQDRLQNVYNDKTAPSNQEKQRLRQEFVRKEQEQFARQQQRLQEQKVLRVNREKDMLKQYLQNQMQQKQLKKSMEKQQRRSYNEQVAQYQMSQREFDMMQKQRRREDQRRYDEDLAGQIRTRQQMNNSNGSPAHRTHNPITNPIDFKIGITNPYVINQYEQTKQRFVGDKDLKLKNLAMVGNNSIHTQGRLE